MFDHEPLLKVGIIENAPEIRGEFRRDYLVGGAKTLHGLFTARVKNRNVEVSDSYGNVLSAAPEIRSSPSGAATFSLHDVTIGIQFHWERKETQVFQGNLILLTQDGSTVTAINEISLEDYLRSVVSSEMNAEAPREFLRAHAIVSRSWLGAMLDRKTTKTDEEESAPKTAPSDHEKIVWYDREDHPMFDVCADDHCQRYQGITKIITREANDAVESTRGQFLVWKSHICDARYYKACGGRTENFESAWQDTEIPYLKSISDSKQEFPVIVFEADAEEWIQSRPEAFCNVTDDVFLKTILPSFDLETKDFFRWRVEYSREDLEKIVAKKSGIDFGRILDLVPIERGPSGRIIKLKVVGEKNTVVVGKELEIRRWLSDSHLYSSAFMVKAEKDEEGIPTRFVLFGAGWGHGVGMCQIGAAVMAAQGRKAESIVRHYFRGAGIKRLYR